MSHPYPHSLINRLADRLNDLLINVTLRISRHQHRKRLILSSPPSSTLDNNKEQFCHLDIWYLVVVVVIVEGRVAVVVKEVHPGPVHRPVVVVVDSALSIYTHTTNFWKCNIPMTLPVWAKRGGFLHLKKSSWPEVKQYENNYSKTQEYIKYVTLEWLYKCD